MAPCTFFGHADTPDRVAPSLRSVLVDLIEHHEVSVFYVGNHGNFDRLVARTLQELQQIYPHVTFRVVLAYLPTMDTHGSTNTLYPAGIETVPKRFAIVWRNRWMLNKSDYVITYVCSPTGGAAKFKTLAEKQDKIVINLSDCL